MMSLRIGITGGIGSGKSIVSRLLKQMGVPVYDSDYEAKCITLTDDSVREGLTKLLGEEVYRGGVLNKPFLASYLFASSENSKRVEQIIHPAVKRHFQRWCEIHSSSPIVAMESAILIESGFTDCVDVVLLVTAPLEMRLARAVARDNVDEAKIRERMALQLSDEEKQKHAHHVIVNDGKTPLIRQVLELFTFLSQNNVYLCDAKK